MNIETVQLADLPAIRYTAPDRVANARAHLDRGESPPPLLLLRSKRGLEVYDGISRITAARERGLASLPAVIVDSTTKAVDLRAKLSKYPSIAEAWEALLET